MIEVSNKIVIFLDILGFSNLTLENEIDLISIKKRHGTLDEQFGYRKVRNAFLKNIKNQSMIRKIKLVSQWLIN